MPGTWESAELQRDLAAPGAPGQVKIKYRESLGLVDIMVTTWYNLQPVSVSRYQECVTEAVYLVIDTPLQSGIIWPPTFIFAE